MIGLRSRGSIARDFRAARGFCNPDLSAQASEYEFSPPAGRAHEREQCPSRGSVFQPLKREECTQPARRFRGDKGLPKRFTPAARGVDAVAASWEIVALNDLGPDGAQHDRGETL